MKNLTTNNKKKVTNNDKSIIMKRAYKVFKTNNISWSGALKQSWATFKNEVKMSFEQIYKDYYKRVLNSCIKKVQTIEIAEEITSDTFLKFYKIYNKGNFDARKSAINTYLHVILNSCLSDLFRREKKRKNDLRISNYVDDTGKEFFQLPSEYQTDSMANTNETMQVIDNEFNTILSEKMQKVANLYFIKDLPYNDIADLLNIPLGSVKGYISRIKNTLKSSKKIQKLYSV